MEKERRKIRRKEMPQKEKIEIKNVTRQNSELHALITEYKVTPSEEKDKDGMSSCENSEAKCTDTKGKLLGQVATLTSEVSRLESECSSLQVQLDCERDKYNKLLGESLAHEKLSEDVITEPKGDYITIYQLQRGVMKQQARERELDLASLHHE
ncbi:uncharacterized protein LOC135113525 isoform X1 [Scylla paramamosain]|uniref:uncharacterized protein LOC135113525 isoform X1 n=2 Tax=Scylla paramamosain TaxID=85552 RepID=UPI00308370A8